MIPNSQGSGFAATIGYMKEKMADALAQVTAYGYAINEKYGDLNLRRYAVVSLGYERIWWQPA
jgi:hypothetical protein